MFNDRFYTTNCYRLLMTAVIILTSFSVLMAIVQADEPFETDYGWETVDLTYAFQNGTSDIAGNGEKQGVRDAFAIWSGEVAMTFTEISDVDEANIVIKWEAVDGEYDELAEADWDRFLESTFVIDPITGGIIVTPGELTYVTGCTITFDEDEAWTLDVRPDGGVQPIDLVTVAAHEIGHCLGLFDHSDDDNTLMYDSYSAQGSMRELHPEDRGRIQLLYPAIAIKGDVNCDLEINVVDALSIMQYEVGLRSDSGGCPLADSATELNVTHADVNDDGAINVIDALLIMQCDVDISNVFCP